MSVLVTSVPAVPAIGAALASACGFALSTSLQHRVAGTAPVHVRGPVQTLLHLLLRPLWVLGAIVGALSLGLNAVALNLGALALVQPLMVAGVVLAVPVRAAMDRRYPSGRELVAVSLAALGLAAFTVVVDPTPGTAPLANSPAVGFTVLGLAIVAGAVCTVTRHKKPGTRALALGAAAGIFFGLTAALLKLLTQQLHTEGLWATAAGWPLWAMAGAGICGLAINQCAYRIAPLSGSMPVVNVVDVLIAVTLGWLLFGEVPAHSAVGLVVQVGALACMGIGLRLIVRAHSAGPNPPEPPSNTPTRPPVVSGSR
ncbi:DMT family transporter [Actinopolymorpha pittospori]